jgi:hypothetical protein
MSKALGKSSPQLIVKNPGRKIIFYLLLNVQPCQRGLNRSSLQVGAEDGIQQTFLPLKLFIFFTETNCDSHIKVGDIHFNPPVQTSNA